MAAPSAVLPSPQTNSPVNGFDDIGGGDNGSFGGGDDLSCGEAFGGGDDLGGGDDFGGGGG